MNVLIACEESQRSCIEFRRNGHNAFSCDILDCSGGHPEWHIKTDVLQILNPEPLYRFNEIYGIEFCTSDGEYHWFEGKWDLIIAHPPCTYLTNTGNSWFNIEKYGQKAIDRYKKRSLAANFFMNFVNAECDKICIENPIGFMSTYYRKPDQIIHPFMFGDPERKATCLWLKNLPKLQATDIVEPVIIYYKNGTGSDSPWHMNSMSLPKEERSRVRSQTFPGIAKAFANQWGNI